MKLPELVEKLELKVVSGAGALDREVTGGYVGDLLSDVMANSDKGQAWVTIQGHINVVAVGTLKELAAVILVNGREPAPDTVAKADEEGLPILLSGLSAFELSGKLYALIGS